MVDINRFSGLKDKLARPSTIHSINRIDKFASKDAKSEQKKGEKRFKVEIRDRIEIKDRTYVSTENWLG